MATKNELKINTKDGEMRVCVMDITPKKANEFLCLNTNNRNMRSSRVKLYSNEMASGNWKANGMPIIIGNDGELKDGQHRLQACVKSGKTLQNSLVVYLPKQQANCFDLGAIRSARDIAIFAGLTDDAFYRSNNMFAAIHTAVCGAKTHKGYSKLALIQEMEANKDACEFIYYNVVIKCRMKKGINIVKAPLTGAIYNAYLNGYNVDKLEEFCRILGTGIAKQDEDAVVIQLRDAAITIKDGNKDQRANLYMKAQLALHLYENGENVQTLGKNKIEYYPHPSKAKESDDGQLSFE